jgi:protein tyrosine/serine phosphatase
MHRTRDLDWDGCLNVRDLGGLPTEDGGETRFGAVVRADSVRRLSDRGWAALVEYGVRRIVDLRWHDELEADPPRELPVEVVHVSLFGDYDPAFGREVDAVGGAQPDEAAATRAIYLLYLERYAENFAGAISAVAGAPEGPVVVHCAVGKDRTGLTIALLLRLAGVGADDVARDYAASGENLRGELERWASEGETERERQRRRRLGATPARAMRDVLDELEHRHGAAADYLRAAGAADGDLARARARLRG